jgi:hypothetical protein
MKIFDEKMTIFGEKFKFLNFLVKIWSFLVKNNNGGPLYFSKIWIKHKGGPLGNIFPFFVMGTRAPLCIRHWAPAKKFFGLMFFSAFIRVWGVPGPQCTYGPAPR